MKRSVLLAAIFSIVPNVLLAQDTVRVAECFAAAYPETVQINTDGGIDVQGQSIPITQSQAQTFAKQLDDAGLIDQISQPYPKDFYVPAENEDPGRLRNGTFFDAMYGSDKQSISQHLAPTYWAPSGGNVTFNTLNGANVALEAVGKAIAVQPDLIPYARKTNGTFNYRTIAGTQRKSAHAYGIAIDIEFPKPLYQYWKWSGCKIGSPCQYPDALLKDEKLQRIVQIFEQYGFIWGGKWHHYDSMHFEYRPELLHPECQ